MESVIERTSPAVQEANRQPWSANEKMELIALWEPVGSVIVLAAMFGRPVSSVQSEASRQNLPQRAVPEGYSSGPWHKEDEVALANAVKRFTRPDGRIDFMGVADVVRRAPDACILRYATMKNLKREDMRPRIYVSSALSAQHALAKLKKFKRPPRHASGLRTCLVCEKPFNSTHAGNRICKRCSLDRTGLA